MCERYVIRFLEDPNYEEMIKAIRGKRHRAGISLCTYAQRSLCEPVTLADAGCSFGVVEGLRMGKLPREEEISDLEKCYQKTVVWVNLVKEQGITDFSFGKTK